MGNCTSQQTDLDKRRLSTEDRDHDNLHSGLIWIQKSEILGKKYKVVGELGKGGVGDVHLVQCKSSFASSCSFVSNNGCSSDISSDKLQKGPEYLQEPFGNMEGALCERHQSPTVSNTITSGRSSFPEDPHECHSTPKGLTCGTSEMDSGKTDNVSVSTAQHSMESIFSNGKCPRTTCMHSVKEERSLRNECCPAELSIDSTFEYDCSYSDEKQIGSKDYKIPMGSMNNGLHNGGMGRKRDLRRYAMKTMYLDRVSKKLYRELEHEVLVLKKLDHPHIIRCREVFLYDEKICLILDLCQGGTLRNAKLDEPDVCTVMTQVSCALNYLHHTCGIAHRDLKLENILLENKDRPIHVRLVDFGLSSNFCIGKKLAGSGGTPYTMAPELVLEGEGYTEKTDMWSVGVMIYILLGKSCPFVRDADDLGNPKLMDNYSLAQYSLEDPIWKKVSDPAKELIKNLLVRSPGSRWDACQTLRYCEEVWDKEFNRTTTPHASCIPLDSLLTFNDEHEQVSLFDIYCSMRRFANYSKLKKTALIIAAFTSSCHEYATLREWFLEMNMDKTGHIKREVSDLNMLDNLKLF